MATPDMSKRSEELRLQGNDLYREGKITAAIPLYEEASKLAPSATSPWSNLAAAYYELGQYEASIKAAHTGLRLFPESAESSSKSKLTTRMAKASSLCQRSSDDVVNGTDPTDLGGRKAVRLQQRAAQLPRFKPMMYEMLSLAPRAVLTKCQTNWTRVLHCRTCRCS